MPKELKADITECAMDLETDDGDGESLNGNVYGGPTGSEVTLAD